MRGKGDGIQREGEGVGRVRADMFAMQPKAASLQETLGAGQ